MLISYQLGQNSIVLRVKLRNAASASANGLLGLTFASTGLRIAAIADNEATTTAYTQAGSTIESITTLGTYATPTATKCRFREVDATNHPGVCEIHIDNTRYAVTSAKSLLISFSGAPGMAETEALVPLWAVNPYSAASFMTGVNGLAPLSSGTGVGQISLAAGLVTIGTNNDKAGYSLSSAGLDNIPVTATTGPATTFAQMVVQLWRRSEKKAIRSTTQIKTYADDGTTVLTTQAITDDGAGNETLGAST